MANKGYASGRWIAPPGWPKTKKDLEGRKIQLVKDVDTSGLHIKAGTILLIERSSNGKVHCISEKACPHCGVGVRVYFQGVDVTLYGVLLPDKSVELTKLILKLSDARSHSLIKSLLLEIIERGEELSSQDVGEITRIISSRKLLHYTGISEHVSKMILTLTGSKESIWSSTTWDDLYPQVEWYLRQKHIIDGVYTNIARSATRMALHGASQGNLDHLNKMAELFDWLLGRFPVDSLQWTRALVALSTLGAYIGEDRRTKVYGLAIELFNSDRRSGNTRVCDLNTLKALIDLHERAEKRTGSSLYGDIRDFNKAVHELAEFWKRIEGRE